MAETAFFKTFSGSAPENYERYFVPYIGRPFADELINSAALQPGERVLDVACGTGVVTRLAAERVGPEGAVSGLDMNQGMLAVAQSVTSTDTPVSWHESSAEAMPLPDENFDVVLCQLGLQFMTDKVAALKEMYRVLSPGGRLVLGLVGPTPPPFEIFANALGRHISPEIAPFVHMVFSLHEPDEVQSLVREAGFRDVSTQVHNHKLKLPPPRDFLWQYVHSTPLVGPVSQADEDSLAALEQDVVDQWQAFVEDGALTMSPPMVLATARK